MWSLLSICNPKQGYPGPTLLYLPLLSSNPPPSPFLSASFSINRAKMAAIPSLSRVIGPSLPSDWIKNTIRKRELFAVEMRREWRNSAARRRRIQSKPQNCCISIPEQPLPEGKLSVLMDILVSETESPDVYLQAMVELREMLSNEENPPIEVMTQTGFVPLIVKFIDETEYLAEIVLEATWVVCNLAAGPKETTGQIVACGGVEALLSLLTQDSPELLETSIWALSNLAFDGVFYRDLLLTRNFHLSLLSLILDPPDLPPVLSRVISWSLAALTRLKPSISKSILVTILPGIQRLATLPDPETQVEVLNLLGNITNLESDFCELVICAGLVTYTYAFLSATESDFLLPALRVICNLIESSEYMIQSLLDMKMLDRLEPLITHTHSGIRTNAVWILSTLTSGTEAQIQSFLSHKVSITALQALQDTHYFTQKEALWMIEDIVRRGNPQQQISIIHSELMNRLSEVLRLDVELARKAVDIMEKMLEVGEVERVEVGYMQNRTAVLMESTGALTHLEHLTQHPNSTLASTCVRLLETYFEGQQAL